MSGDLLGSLSLGGDKSQAAGSQTGGNQQFTVGGNPSNLPASFWGTPNLLGGTSSVSIGSFHVGTLFVVLGFGLGLWYLHRKGKI